MMKRITSGLSDVRGELFGFSIITIILFHFFEDVEQADFGGAAKVMTKIYNLALGSGGVEIFLFLSGMGLFYSLSGDPRLRDFYRKRLVRILPAYLVIGGAGWLILDILLRKTGWLPFLRDFSTVSFWTEGERMVWYISLILILYLLFPLLYRLIAIPGRRLAAALTVVLTAAVMAGCLTLHFLSPGVYDRIEIALWRVAPFILGAWYGRKARSGQSFTAEAVILCRRSRSRKTASALRLISVPLLSCVPPKAKLTIISLSIRKNNRSAAHMLPADRLILLYFLNCCYLFAYRKIKNTCGQILCKIFVQNRQN